jgi:hypothetical protein
MAIGVAARGSALSARATGAGLLGGGATDARRAVRGARAALAAGEIVEARGFPGPVVAAA